MNAIDIRGADPSADDERAGLPPWTYFNKELFEIEQEELFRRHWQLACHVSDIPKPGDWTSLRHRRRARTHRARQGQCRARLPQCLPASRLAASSRARAGAARAPWSVRSMAGPTISTERCAPCPRPRPFPSSIRSQHGLVPLEHEIWHGFVFVRFKPGPQPLGRRAHGAP